jgi:hypothetical protein
LNAFCTKDRRQSFPAIEGDAGGNIGDICGDISGDIFGISDEMFGESDGDSIGDIIGEFLGIGDLEDRGDSVEAENNSNE